MIWQDWVFSIGAIVLNISLLPSIFSNDKPAWTTSIITAIVSYVVSAVFFSLNLYLSTVIIFISATLWLILFLQVKLFRKTSNFDEAS
jgi:hypothetical protein